MRNSEICVFDEPNASLDLISEKDILNTICEEIKGKIGILIIHRFGSIIHKSAKIVIMNNGGIDGIGTHQELIENNEIYSKLYTIQNEN